METLGDFSAWTGNISVVGTTLVVSVADHHHGVNSMLATAGGAGGYKMYYKDIADHDILYVRLYVKITGSPDVTVDFINLNDTGWGMHTGLGVTSTRALYLEWFDVGWNSDTSATVLALNTWYCLEFMFDRTNGELGVWLDGVRINDLTHTALALVATVNRVHVGLIGSTEQEIWGTATVYEDCVVVADARIYCEAAAAPKGTIAINAKIAEII